MNGTQFRAILILYWMFLKLYPVVLIILWVKFLEYEKKKNIKTLIIKI